MKKLLIMINLYFILGAIVGLYIDEVQAQERIESIRFNKSKVQRIYLAPGLGSVVIFPCGIQEIFIGRSDDLKAQISPNDKKTMFLNLKLNSSLPTNVIVKCFPENNVFVFDVIPNKVKHQDFVEIKSVFGRPQYNSSFQIQEITQAKVVNRLIVKKAELIDKGAK